MPYALLTTPTLPAKINLHCISRALWLPRASVVQLRHATNQTVGVVQLGSEAIQLIQQSIQVGIGISPNVTLNPYRCGCGEFHIEGAGHVNFLPNRRRRTVRGSRCAHGPLPYNRPRLSRDVAMYSTKRGCVRFAVLTK